MLSLLNIRKLYRFFVCLFLVGLCCIFTAGAGVIVHDISKGSLVIPGNSADDYVITGVADTSFVIVETGYRGVITLRNLNITLDVTRVINELWSEKFPIFLAEMKEQDEYQEKKHELEELLRELEELPDREDYAEKKEKLDDLYQELEERKQQDDYQNLQKEIDTLYEELEDRKQQSDYQAKQKELEDLYNQINNISLHPDYQAIVKDVEDLNSKRQQELQPKQQELSTLEQQLQDHPDAKELQNKWTQYYELLYREEYPGKQQDLQNLLNDIQALQNKVDDLPLNNDIAAKQKEINDINLKYDNDVNTKWQQVEVLEADIWKAIAAVQDEMWKKEEPIWEKIHPKANERWAIEEPFWQEIWVLEEELRRMIDNFNDDIAAIQFELEEMEYAVELETYEKQHKLYQILSNSPISVRGKDGQSNLTPVTNVDFILEGDNVLLYTGTAGFPAFHVEQGAQINISAINPSDNNSGTLKATVANEHGGAGIGAISHEGYGTFGNITYMEAIATTNILGNNCFELPTAGGNIVISSGTVTAQGGHGAGIGGGWGTYYDGMIVIYGGVVDASAIRHAAGIGSGCPTGIGIIACYTTNSAIIVLPPATITAAGAGDAAYVRRPDLALAGSNVIVYIGDPEKPEIEVHTVDWEPFANIYVDLSESPDIARVIYATVPDDRLDIRQIFFGQTDADRYFRFHGLLNDSITFFTDAVSTETNGRPYIPKKALLDGKPENLTVVLNLLEAQLSIDAEAADDLCENYSAAEALSTAFRVKITYSDYIPMSNIKFDMADGNNSDFSETGMRFYASDGFTEISAPTTFYENDVIYVAIPLKTGRAQDIYSDVFRFSGTWNGMSSGYIRQIVTQSVGMLEINAITDLDEGGGTTAGSDFYACGQMVTLTAIPDVGYNFVNWTRRGQEVSQNANFTFTATEGVTYVANFALKTYNISAPVNPTLGGTTSGAGIYTHGDEVELTATANPNYKFENWSENGVILSSDDTYTFVATDNRNLTANFRLFYVVTVDVNNPDYGNSTGGGEFFENSNVQVEALVNNCYRFANWTIDGVVVSTEKTYAFDVYRDVTIVANFYALDFDVYAPVLWDNKFMLNLNKLDEDGYDITGCRWFKNGVEERDTRTINEFSYSAGPNTNDRLEPAPTYYMFQIITRNLGALCSSNKYINFVPSYASTSSGLTVYPNPVPSGSQVFIEGADKGSIIYIYNMSGVRVNSAVATDETVMLTVPDAGGVYLIRNGDESIKIVVTN